MKTFLDRLIRLVAVVLCACLPAAATVTVIESSASRLVFRWQAGSLDTASELDSGKIVTNLGIGGENISLGTSGEPEIPGISAYAGIPPSGNIRISFVPGPIQTIILKHPVKRIPTAVKGALPLQQRVQFLGEWLSEPRYTWFKTMRAAQLVIRACNCGNDGLTVQMLKSGVCTVQFPTASAPSMPRPPATAYQRMLNRLLLNYKVASAWISAPAQKGLLKAADISPFDLTDPSVRTFTIGDGHEGMNSLTTNENGILKITGSQLLRLFNADPGTLRMGEVALFGSWKGELPADCPAPGAIPPGITEIPLFRVDHNGNGMVDTDDYVCAYVTGLSDWAYDTSRRDFTYVLDNYDDNRHYWLGLKPAGDGATMSRFVQPPGNGDTSDYFINRVMFGQPVYRPGTPSGSSLTDMDAVGYTWARLSPFNPSFNVQLNLPKLDTTAVGTFNVQLNLPKVDSTAVGTLFLTLYSGGSLPVTAYIDGDTICPNCGGGAGYPVTAWGDRNLHFLYANLLDTNFWQLQYVQADYLAHLAETSDTVRMPVFSFSDSGIRTYRFSGGTGHLSIFRIPCVESAISWIDTVPASAPYAWSDSSNSGARYFICNENGFITLPDASFSLAPARLSSATGYAVADLRATRNQADYLIVTHPAFLSQAEQLAKFKTKCGFTRPRIVSINDVYTDFSGGNLDPSALRNFLAYAVRDWETRDSLDYVFLLGGGSYDYKQITTRESNYIPPAEPGNLCSDDFYGELTPGPSTDLSLAIGRVPCLAVTQASAAINKIIAVEDTQTADWSSWRNNMLFVADDDRQNNNGALVSDPISGADAHYISSENTCALVQAGRPAMDVQKIYLYSYPWDANNHKPECAAAILNAINSGLGYVNYFGHGSSVVWADEHVLTTDMVPQMTNANQYPIIASFSCTVGNFDTPDVTGLSALLVETPQAGAVATFSATREAAPEENTTLAEDLYGYLFSPDSDAVYGMAIIAAKAEDNYSPNSSIYALFGDPSLKIVPPARNILLKITSTRADSGKPLDTLKALQKIRICGAVLTPGGQPDPQYGTTTPAFVQLGIFNPPYLGSRTDGGTWDTTIHWMAPGVPVFCSKSPISNGTFDLTALLPRNLVFGTPGAKLLAYAWEGSTLGLGCNDSIVFNGTDTSGSSIKDTVGPQISIRPVYDTSLLTANNVSFTDHLAGSLPLKCEICLSDPDGINVVGAGPDEGLTMEIPGSLARCNINNKFQFAAGDYRKGSAVVSFGANSLKAGSYTLCITAQDLLGNVSKAAFGLNITNPDSFSLDHVFNMPNPMRMGGTTRFYFSSSSTSWYRPQNWENEGLSSLNITIKIYSLSGRLLRVLQDIQNGEVWDGRDQTGYPLPPDVYLYQASANYQVVTGSIQSGLQSTKSKIQKLVIYPPQH